MAGGIPFVPTHSVFETLDVCPRQYQAKYVTKEIKFKANEHVDLGNVLHRLAEWYVWLKRGKVAPVTFDTPVLSETEYETAKAITTSFLCPPLNEVRVHWAELRNVIDKLPMQFGTEIATEVSLAFDHDFAPVHYMDKMGAFRAKIDLLLVLGNIAVLIDWKSSKTMKGSPQLVRSALCVFVNRPNVDTIYTMFVSSRGQTPIKDEIHRIDFLDLYNEYVNKPTLELRERYAFNSWPPKKSGLCKAHCDVVNCPENGKRG